jgi:hypothetical protein
MKLKTITGLLTAGILIASCATNPVQQNSVKGKDIVSTENTTNRGATIKFKITMPGFKTKATGNGQSSNNIHHFKAAVSQNDSEAPDFHGSDWHEFGWEDRENINFESVGDGVWYGYIRAFDSEGHELTAENPDLGNQRAARSENNLFVHNDDFYTGDDFKIKDNHRNTFNLTLPIENTGASISAEFNINESAEIPPIDIE